MPCIPHHSPYFNFSHRTPILSNNTNKKTSQNQSFSTPLYKGTPTDPTSKLTLLTATTPTPKTALITLGYTIPSFYTNPMGNLHGAAHALIHDNCTSLAMAAVSKPSFWMFSGVSRVLDVKYLRGVKVGERVTIECEVVHVGGKAAALRGVIKDEQGRVCSTCEHDKSNIDPPLEKARDAKL